MKVVLDGSYVSAKADLLKGALGSDFEVIALPDEAGEATRAAVFAEAEILVARGFGADAPPVPRLKLLHCALAGYEGIDMGRLPPDVTVACAQGHEIAMAEYVLCAMLDHAIGWRAMTGRLGDGTWSLDDWHRGPRHGEVFGRTLGLAGYGATARALGPRARALGLEVRALSRWSFGRPGPEAVDACYTADERAAFLDGIDYLVVTLPLTPATEGSIDAAWFAEMSDRAVVINVARGPVIDEAALFDALRDGRIGGAVLDVWYRYPPDGETRVPVSRLPFHTLDNVVMTPHASARTPQTFERRWAGIADTIKAFADGRPPRGVPRG